MDICGQRRHRLRPGKPHRFSRLQRRRRGLQLLQPRNPINPHRIRHSVRSPFAGGDIVCQCREHGVEPAGQRIDGKPSEKVLASGLVVRGFRELLVKPLFPEPSVPGGRAQMPASGRVGRWRPGARTAGDRRRYRSPPIRQS